MTKVDTHLQCSWWVWTWPCGRKQSQVPTALVQTSLAVGRRPASLRHSVSLLTLSTFWFSYLLTFVRGLTVHSRDTHHAIIHAHVQNTRKGVSRVLTFPSPWNQGLPCLLAFTLTLQASVLFLLGFCALCWQLHCLKWAPSTTLKNRLVFREREFLTEKLCQCASFS